MVIAVGNDPCEGWGKYLALDNNEGKCYKIIGPPLNYGYNRAYCEKEDGKFAEPMNSKENEFIKSVMRDEGVGRAHIGILSPKQDNKY